MLIHFKSVLLSKPQLQILPFRISTLRHSSWDQWSRESTSIADLRNGVSEFQSSIIVLADT